MKIFLVFSRKTAGPSNIAPLGIMNIASVLRNNGYAELKLFDMAYDSIENITDEICSAHPDIVGISSDTISFNRAVEFVNSFKSQGAAAKVILGGVHATIQPEEALRSMRADVAVIGEGEATVVELVNAIESSGDLSEVKGIAFLRDGICVRTEPREFIADLDALPMAARDLLPMQKYLRAKPDLPMLFPTMAIFTSRGCKGNCCYCQPVMRTLYGSKIRKRSVSNVMEEVRYLKKEYGFASLYFADDELLFNGEDWMHELCDAFITHGGIRWTCQCRVDQIRDDIVRHMKESGCYAVGLGVESGSDKILKYMQKGYKAAQIQPAFAILRKHGIIATCNLMVGTPGEDASTIAETAAMIRTVKPDLVRCSITTPTPGSALYTRMKSEDRINVKSLDDFDRWAAYPIRLDGFDREMVRVSVGMLLGEFYREFLKTLVNPMLWLRRWYFFKVLLTRYVQMIVRDPKGVFSDVWFYLTYYKHRKGRD